MEDISNSYEATAVNRLICTLEQCDSNIFKLALSREDSKIVLHALKNYRDMLVLCGIYPDTEVNND